MNEPRNGPQPVDMFCQNIINAAKVTPEATVMQMGFAVIGELLDQILAEMRASNSLIHDIKNEASR